MTIGARVVKTGLAVALALLLSDWFQLSSPLIAAVAAIFTIQPSIYRSWKQVLDQVQSNVLGAIVALSAVQVLGSTPFAIGLVCIAIILINIRLRMESAIALTLVTVVAVMEAHSEGWLYAMERFGMVMTGIAAAFAVNVLLFPPRPKRQFIAQVNEAFVGLSLLLRTAVSNEMKEQVYNEEKRKLTETLRKLVERYKLFEEERVISARKKKEQTLQLLVSKQLIKTLQQGEYLLESVEEHFFASTGQAQWSKKLDIKIEELTKYHEQLLLKLEGKVKHHAELAPQEEEGFAEELSSYVCESPKDHERLLFVTSALYEYAYQLRRLDKVLQQVQERVPSRDK